MVDTQEAAESQLAPVALLVRGLRYAHSDAERISVLSRRLPVLLGGAASADDDYDSEDDEEEAGGDAAAAEGVESKADADGAGGAGGAEGESVELTVKQARKICRALLQVRLVRVCVCGDGSFHLSVPLSPFSRHPAQCTT